ncbi:MAG: SLC13 family permease [Candidatus Caldarchaeum sp.]
MERTLSLVIFILAYVSFVVFPSQRPWMALLASGILIFAGVVSPTLAFLGEGDKDALVSWNVMGIFIGTLMLADLFIWSRVPHYVAERLVNRSRSVCSAMVKICAFSGFLSIFAENVAVVLIVAPIAFALAEKLNISPVPLVIGVAVASNVQGTATLIGDPASMVFAEYANASFNDFFWYKGHGVGIFFFIQIGFLISLLVLYWHFRHLDDRQGLIPEEKVVSWAPFWFLVAMIVGLAVASSLQKHGWLGIICMVCGVAGLIWYEISGRKDRDKFPDTPLTIIKRLDWQSAFFLIGIFIIVGALVERGWVESFADWIQARLVGSIFISFLVIILFSMLVSAFVDNIPYLMAMIPVVMRLAEPGKGQEVLLFGLLIAASLGGNVTPVGASANIVGVGQLRQKGLHVGFWEFARIGLPYTIFATLPAAGILYLLWWVFR